MRNGMAHQWSSIAEGLPVFFKKNKKSYGCLLNIGTKGYITYCFFGFLDASLLFRLPQLSVNQ